MQLQAEVRKDTNVLVTGTRGFIGGGLFNYLQAKGRQVRGTVRNSPADGTEEEITTGEIGPDTDWSTALAGTDVVVHAAGRTGEDGNPEKLWSVNTAGSLNLARQAVKCGVTRFIYLSTIKVHGENSGDRAFKPDDILQPSTVYARSKLEAEQGLRRIAENTGLELIIIRPPVVYGPGVKGSFLSLLHLLNKGIPLPLAAINNRRSLLGLDNLLDFTGLCLVHSRAPGHTFLISDGEDLSTPEIIRRLAGYMDRSPLLFPVPSRLLASAAVLAGKKKLITQLRASLQVDSSGAREVLSWKPPLSVDEGFQQTVNWYKRYV